MAEIQLHNVSLTYSAPLREPANRLFEIKKERLQEDLPLETARGVTALDKCKSNHPERADICRGGSFRLRKKHIAARGGGASSMITQVRCFTMGWMCKIFLPKIVISAWSSRIMRCIRTSTMKATCRSFSRCTRSVTRKRASAFVTHPN